jgi:hypothetical protein
VSNYYLTQWIYFLNNQWINLNLSGPQNYFLPHELKVMFTCYKVSLAKLRKKVFENPTKIANVSSFTAVQNQNKKFESSSTFLWHRIISKLSKVMYYAIALRKVRELFHFWLTLSWSEYALFSSYSGHWYLQKVLFDIHFYNLSTILHIFHLVFKVSSFPR